MYSTIYIEWTLIIFVLVWHKSVYFYEDICAKNRNVTFSFPSDLDIWPLEFRPQICFLVTLVHRQVSTKLDVSKAFQFRENRRHGTDKRTDVVQRLMQPPSEGRIITGDRCVVSVSVLDGILGDESCKLVQGRQLQMSLHIDVWQRPTLVRFIHCSHTAQLSSAD